MNRSPHPVRRFAGTALLLALLGPGASHAVATGPAEDSIAQRVQACTACHGPQGRAARDGFYPRIAGKPAGYLFNQLQAFRDGRRAYAPMTALLDPLRGPLGDDYLREIAAHFAATDLPYPAPARPEAGAELLARGRALVLDGDAARQVPACVACHGAAMTGLQPAIPGLLGLPRDYLNAQLGAWRNGTRQARTPDCMAQVARALAPQDIAAVSHWLAAQPVPVPAKAVAALPARLPLDCGGVAP